MLVKCGNCGDEITSKHTHDWQCCSCWKLNKDDKGIYIDGGQEYTRLGGDLYNLTWYNAESKQWEKLEGYE